MRLIVLASLALSLALLLAGHAHPGGGSGQGPQTAYTAHVDIVDGTADLVVEFAGDAAFEAVTGFASSNGLRVKYANAEWGTVSLATNGMSSLVADDISRIPGVLSVSSEMRARIYYTPDDEYLSRQWGLDTVDAYESWDIAQGDQDIIVAVLDTGIDWNHPDLVDSMWENDAGYHGYDFIDDTWFPMDDNVNGYDDDGDWLSNIYTYHGTHVAGIVGASMDNAIGIAGLSRVSLMAVKVMNDSGEGTDVTVANGVRWATDNGADIITMSLGVDGVSTPLQNAISYASSRNVVMVAAAGNEGMSVISYPAAFPQVIGVGATDSLDRRASFSNFGAGLDVMAPGVGIFSTQGGGSYQELSGTSAAAPHVAAIAATILSVAPALSPEEIGDIINSTATDLSIAGYDTSTGWGVVNAFRAVEEISSPRVTITEYPEYAAPNSTFSVSWMVSGGDPGDIEETYVSWGPASTSLDDDSAVYSGITWAFFTVETVTALPHNGTMFIMATATVDGVVYESEVLALSVHETVSDNILMDFLRDVQDFIFNDMGITNFLLVIGILAAVVVVMAAARPKRRRVSTSSRASPPQPVRHPATVGRLDGFSPVAGSPQGAPPPPPPPPRYESYVDLVGRDIVPPTLRIMEGTKVVWVNRTWAPPPGLAVKSGRVDETGEHPDGLFQSGLLISPGDYWSVTFHRMGTYEYYITGLWKQARVIVEPFKKDQSPPGVA
jgi:subtilisin family serine protease